MTIPVRTINHVWCHDIVRRMQEIYLLDGYWAERYLVGRDAPRGSVHKAEARKTEDPSLVYVDFNRFDTCGGARTRILEDLCNRGEIPPGSYEIHLYG